MLMHLAWPIDRLAMANTFFLESWRDLYLLTIKFPRVRSDENKVSFLITSKVGLERLELLTMIPKAWGKVEDEKDEKWVVLL